MDPEPLEGDLGLGTLPWLLARLNQEQRTGVLHVLVDGVERRVFFKWGFVLFASSSLPADRLDQRLLREGQVSEATVAKAHERLKVTEKRFGECLVEMKAITQEELHRAVERQVRDIITFLFSISRGHFRFEPSEEPIDGDLMLDLPMQRILLDGIRSMSDPLALRIGVGPMTDVLQVDSRSPTTDEPRLNTSEAFLLSRIDGKSSVLDLLAISPLGEVETLRSLAALLSVGVARAG
ncbi:MAG TPA: DUF4388 domain-containing protein [Vicinamibacteria bacterium]|nr:DUF4388 domain-containing protein [Vicinamibacteria bacterium]